MEMYNPEHPGILIKEMYLAEYNLSISAFALRIGISRNTASELVNGKQGISADMAVKLAKAFKTSAQFWLNLQNQYDLWQARKRVDLSKVQVIAM